MTDSWGWIGMVWRCRRLAINDARFRRTETGTNTSEGSFALRPDGQSRLSP